MALTRNQLMQLANFRKLALQNKLSAAIQSRPALNQQYPTIGGSATSTTAMENATLYNKFPELKNVTDPALLKEISSIPKLNYDDVPFGPGFQEYKGKPSSYLWGSHMRNVMTSLGFYDPDAKKVKIPTNAEEVSKWKWMDSYLRGTKQNNYVAPKQGEEGFEHYDKVSRALYPQKYAHDYLTEQAKTTPTYAKSDPWDAI